MTAVRVGSFDSLANAFTQALFPALCVACGGLLTGQDHGLCGACRSRLVPLSGPGCPRCGVPSDVDEELCLACVAHAPPQDATVVWGSYDGVLRRAILALKHRGHDELARPLARRLAARIGTAPWSGSISVVVEVPSHAVRRLRRKTCAATLLAAQTATALGLRHLNVLRRHGLGRQAGRSRAQRHRLARGTFSARRHLHGEHVLLVDDVTTTGTTLRRASEALKDAGAEAVSCAVLALAPDPRRV